MKTRLYLLGIFLFIVATAVKAQEVSMKDGKYTASKVYVVEGLDCSQIYNIIKNYPYLSGDGELISFTPENNSVILKVGREWEKDPMGRIVPLCVKAACLIKENKLKIVLYSFHKEIHASMDRNSRILEVSIDKAVFSDSEKQKLNDYVKNIFDDIDNLINCMKEEYLFH